MSTPFNFRFEIDVTGDALRDRDPKKVEAALSAVSFKMAQLARGMWVALATRLNVRATGAYIRGIDEGGKINKVSEGVEGTTFSSQFDIINTAAHAQFVEEGHRAFSLPDAIDWGSTAGSIKMGKNGPYLHVAFRHTAYNSPAAIERSRAGRGGGITNAAIKAMMPQHIHREAMRLDATRANREGPFRRDDDGRLIAKDRYTWGGRLDRGDSTPRIIMGGPGVRSAGGPGERGYEEHRSGRQVGRDSKGRPLTNPAWQSSKYHGLFRTEQKKAGGGHDSVFLTIRTITPESRGWRIPATVGYGVARKLAFGIQYRDHRMREMFTKALLDALGEPV